MKKILLATYSLDIGGIEKAFISLVNSLKEEYDITIVLEKKQGIFLNEIDKKINVIEYSPASDKNVLVRKLKNICKRIKFILKYKNRFDFSASFATYSKSCSFVARIASKNCCLWGHADYLTLFDGEEEKVKGFFEDVKYDKFKNIVFVSNEGKNSFLQVFPKMNEKVSVCNNLIEYKKIKEKANEKIEMNKNKCVTFLNVGRHDERQKKLTRLIEAASMLKKDGYDFEILLVGDGKDSSLYKEKVKQLNLEKNIIFLGKKQNPYPYFKMADCIILTSDYEGYPVVFLESFILERPIITTKVSDYKEVQEKYGLVTEKTVDDIYAKMKEFIEKGFEIKGKFDGEEYNRKIITKIKDLIERK